MVTRERERSRRRSARKRAAWALALTLLAHGLFAGLLACFTQWTVVEAFVDDPAFDQSTESYGLQLSVPVQKAGARIGALTFTLKVPRPTASK